MAFNYILFFFKKIIHLKLRLYKKATLFPINYMLKKYIDFLDFKGTYFFIFVFFNRNILKYIFFIS